MKLQLDFKRYIWGQIASAAISAGGQILSNWQRNEAQRAENERAFEREKQQVAEMNAYNSASAQAARLRAAGLNPNLMYEQNPAAAAGEQNDFAHYQPAQLGSVMDGAGESFASIANSLIGIREQDNQNRLAEAELYIKAKTLDLMDSDIRVNDAQAQNIVELLGYNKEYFSAQSEHYRALATKTIKEFDEIDARVEEIRANRDLALRNIEVQDEYKEQIKATVRNLDAKTVEILALLPEQKRFLAASSAERFAMVASAAYQWDVYDAEKHLKEAQARNEDAEIEKWQRELKVRESTNRRGWYESVLRAATLLGSVMMPGVSLSASLGDVTSLAGLAGAGY